MAETVFSSILSGYINGFLEEKRSLGYDYHTEEVILIRFDRYCMDHDLSTVNVSKSFLDEWCLQSETEGYSYHSKRVDIVRHLMIYMLSLGVEVFVPKTVSRGGRSMPHIFTKEELQSFFYEVDSAEADPHRKNHERLIKEYRVLFRLLYCCGLRNSEGCCIATAQVDLENGILTILNSKGDKDRLVYMSEDLTELCSEYYRYLCSELIEPSEWFFPGLDPKKPLPNTSIDRVFNRFWEKTPFSAKCNNKPTVHDLRFTFVTDRIDLWALQGVDVDVMMPYLQKYLGHKSLQDTYYYYLDSRQLYESVWQKDKTSNLVIPEVADYE